MRKFSAKFRVKFKVMTDPYYPQRKQITIWVEGIPVDEYGFYTPETYAYILDSITRRAADAAGTDKIEIMNYERIKRG